MKMLHKLLLAAALVAAGGARVSAETACTMDFHVKGWSALYKVAHGGGTITCDNGQRADVKIEVKGGGLTAGKSEIRDGKGKFSSVPRIEELFGGYAAASAEAGAVKSAAAMALTKGEVSLALSGTGNGFDIGIAFADFRITRR